METLQSLELQHCDIVFLEIKMPEMAGLEAIRITCQPWPNVTKIIDGKRCLGIECAITTEACLERGSGQRRWRCIG
jgi:CheY-like chemotaxis protein